MLSFITNDALTFIIVKCNVSGFLDETKVGSMFQPLVREFQTKVTPPKVSLGQMATSHQN